MQNKNLKNRTTDGTGLEKVEVIYFTDPLCCWSWAMEPQLRRIKYQYGDQIKWSYRMGGLLPGWNNFNDEINSVSRPIQMGPVWMHAQYVSGMPMDSNIWMRDPPASSYPSCIAFKNASMQSEKAGIRYLRLLREALMIDGKNISKEDVLKDIARMLAEEEVYNFSSEAFNLHLKKDDALELFRKDLQEVQYQQVQRFPTFIIKKGRQGIVLPGFRSYDNFHKALVSTAPDLIKNKEAIDLEEYEVHGGYLTEIEKQAITKV